MAAFQRARKSTLLAYVLWLLLGWLAAHRWYAGARVSALLMMVMITGSFLYLANDPTVAAEWQRVLAYAEQEAVQPSGREFDLNLQGAPGLAVIALGIGSLWWLIDLFLVPGLIRRANQRIAQRMGLMPDLG